MAMRSIAAACRGLRCGEETRRQKVGRRSAGKWPRDDDSTDSEATTTDKESLTPSTTASTEDLESEEPAEEPQLGPGLYHDDVVPTPPQPCAPAPALAPPARDCASAAAAPSVQFTREETLFVFDWDDTILPSSWIQSQGMRLDDGAVAEEQRQQLAALAPLALETLRLAKQHGTVVLVTNAERGWIELSCRKFMPTLLPLLENVRLVSARTSYEGPSAPMPLDWKLRAFEAEISRHYGRDRLWDPCSLKNVFSLGDGIHEREALLRMTAGLPSCRAKSLKFAERPGLAELAKQHALVTSCFQSILNHDAPLDLCIRCT